MVPDALEPLGKRKVLCLPEGLISGRLSVPRLAGEFVLCDVLERCRDNVENLWVGKRQYKGSTRDHQGRVKLQTCFNWVGKSVLKPAVAVQKGKLSAEVAQGRHLGKQTLLSYQTHGRQIDEAV